MDNLNNENNENVNKAPSKLDDVKHSLTGVLLILFVVVLFMSAMQYRDTCQHTEKNEELPITVNETMEVDYE